MQASVKKDLMHWQTKLDLAEKAHDREGIKVAKMFLDKYLDDYNSIKL